MKLYLRQAGRHHQVDVRREADGFVVTIADRTHAVRPLGGGMWEIGGERVKVYSTARGDHTHAVTAGHGFTFTREHRDESGHSLEAALSPQVTAPMPGKVTQVLVEPGAEVASGDPLLILEAMKMENRLVAEAAGTIREVNVGPGEMVNGGQVLLVIDYH